jgi:hypothetical protein
VRPETCAVCDQEVRHGHRDGVAAWWHREAVDHHAILGRRFTAADELEVQRQLDLPRVRLDKDGVEETYTARELQLKAMSKAKRDQLLAEGLDDDEIALLERPEVPEPEVRCTPIERADDRCPQGVRNVMNAAARAGWEVTRLTYSRGPYLGSKGQVLTISDSVVIHVVDGEGHLGVASYRDRKVTSCWWGTIGGRCYLTSITDLKTKMKEAASGHDS